MRRMKVYAIVIFLTVSIGIIFAAGNTILTDLNVAPNPMDKTTTISLSIARDAIVDINVETYNGEIVKTIYTGHISTGNYEFVWNRTGDNGEYAPSGDYYLVINYDAKYTSTKKTLILK